MEMFFKQRISELLEGVFAITLRGIHHTAKTAYDQTNKKYQYVVERYEYEVIYGEGEITTIEVHKYEKDHPYLSFVDFYEVSENRCERIDLRVFNRVTQEWLPKEVYV
jgi:hypothetical protein